MSRRRPEYVKDFHLHSIVQKTYEAAVGGFKEVCLSGEDSSVFRGKCSNILPKINAIRPEIKGLAFDLLNRYLYLYSDDLYDISVMPYWCVDSDLWDSLVLMRYPVELFMCKSIGVATPCLDRLPRASSYKCKLRQFWSPIEDHIEQVMCCPKVIVESVLSYIGGTYSGSQVLTFCMEKSVYKK